MIEVRPVCADDGKARKFQLFEDGKRILELTTSRLMTADELRTVLQPKEVTNDRKGRSRPAA